MCCIMSSCTLNALNTVHFNYNYLGKTNSVAFKMLLSNTTDNEILSIYTLLLDHIQNCILKSVKCYIYFILSGYTDA